VTSRSSTGAACEVVSYRRASPGPVARSRVPGAVLMPAHGHRLRHSPARSIWPFFALRAQLASTPLVPSPIKRAPRQHAAFSSNDATGARTWVWL